MTVLDGIMYAIGGKGKQKDYLNIVEKYDRSSKKWSNITTNMKTKRTGAPAAVQKGFLFVCGGTFQEKALFGCESYDIKKKTWSFMRKMIQHRAYFSLLADGDYLFALGGDSPHYISVEKYDSQKQKWMKLEKKLIQKRSYSSAVLLI